MEPWLDENQLVREFIHRGPLHELNDLAERFLRLGLAAAQLDDQLLQGVLFDDGIPD